MNTRLRTLLVITCLITSALHADNKTSCLVMSPDYSGDCTAATANLFTEHTIRLLNLSTSCKPLPTATAIRRLAEVDVSLQRLPTRKDAVMAAGRILEVQEVMHGSISQTGKQFSVWLKLYETQTGAEIKRAGASFNGTEQAMLAQVIPFLLRKLGISIIPTSTLPPPAETTIKAPPPTPGTPTTRAYDRDSAPAENGQSPLTGHFELGTRITHYALFKTSKNTFLGSIDHLDTDQDYMPLKLYADWMFTPVLGLELSWDRVEAKTITTSSGYTDGTIIMKGPCLAFVARYPDSNPWQPFAGIGMAYLPGEFEAATWWHLGYHTPDVWEAAGSPSIANNGLIRTMEVKDGMGLLMMGGVQYRWDSAWSVDAYFRMLFTDADTHYWITHPNGTMEDRGVTTIPMDSWALGLGVRYSF